MRTACYNTLLFCLLTLAWVTGYGQQTQKMYLSGTGSDRTVKWDFYCSAGRNSGKWTTIPVPSNWELQGFGRYNYGWAKDTARGKEVGQYKYKFKVPSLRNLQYTGPYMHDGRFLSLVGVLEHYHSEVQATPNLDPILNQNGKLGIALDEDQKLKLLAFLNTLNDAEFINNKMLSEQ